MAINFDGDNLLITLESGITEVDVVNDLYKDWKDWMLADPLNRRFPQALVSDGGAPLTAIINQGSYIFLNNTAGWRIKPPEESITIFFVGNLAAADIETNTIVPTTGSFTASVIGLQPITQGVIPSMRTNLEFTAFEGEIALSETGTINTVMPAYLGDDRVGTRRAPAGNLATVKATAVGEGIITIRLIGSYDSTGETDDYSSGYTFTADSLSDEFIISAGLNVANCSFEDMKLSGEVDGSNKIAGCEIETISGFSGDIFSSDLDGDVGLIGTAISGSAHIVDCYSGQAATLYPRLTNCGDQKIIVRNMRGSLGIADMTGGSHSMGIYGGRLVIEASCTGGTIYARGDPYEIVDLSGGAVTVVNQTSSLKVTAMWESMDLDTLPNDKIADMVFKKPAADFTDSSTIGGFIIKKILTVGKFLGLK